MSVALALLAMLIELCRRLSAAVADAIGHPVTWIGAPDRRARPVAQPDSASAGSRRAAGLSRCLFFSTLSERSPSSSSRLCCACRSAFSLVALHRQHLDRATQPAPARGGCRRRARDRRHRRRPHRGVAHRRPRYRRARSKPASPARRSKASRRISPTRLSRPCCGSPLPVFPAPHSTKQSTPRTA